MDEFETYIGQVARKFPYPPTPEIRITSDSRSTPNLRLARAAAMILIVLLGLIAIPPIRAAIQNVFQIGPIHITVTEEVSLEDVQPAVLKDLFGEITIEEAQAQVSFPLRLPAGYGLPDRVYAQEYETIVMVWYAPDAPGEIELALYEIGTGDIVNKMLQVYEPVIVNGQSGLWAVGPHILQYTNANRPTVLVEGSVLIWAEDGVGYRIEAGDDLETTLEIAASLTEWEPESS